MSCTDGEQLALVLSLPSWMWHRQMIPLDQIQHIDLTRSVMDHRAEIYDRIRSHYRKDQK